MNQGESHRKLGKNLGMFKEKTGMHSYYSATRTGCENPLWVRWSQLRAGIALTLNS